MKFSKLISYLKKGSAELQEYDFAQDPRLLGAESLDKAESHQISFLEKGNSLSSELINSKAGAILLPDEEKLRGIAIQKGIAWATLKNPRLAFAECLDLLHPKKQPLVGVHSSAVIGKNVLLGEHVFIGANVYIGDNCRIGSNSLIHPGTVIYEEVVVGEGCEIHANSVIQRKSNLGSQCVIHSNAVIGSEGFGFVPTNEGWRKMPQTGTVVLENEVEIGCGSTVDRPAVGETRIGAGTKIDNLVQIGHGVVTGRGCAMAAQVGIAGGAHLGNGVILAGQVGVGNRVKVGDGVIASSKTGIHADVQSGEVISGFPAMSNKLWLRCSAIFSKLPQLAKTVRQLQK